MKERNIIKPFYKTIIPGGRDIGNIGILFQIACQRLHIL